jgi:phage regulator Rha-like protein
LVIEEYKENNKNLFTYLLIEEFNFLVNETNKIIKNKKYQIKKLEKIENIKLNLSKKDKEFLKVFYG